MDDSNRNYLKEPYEDQFYQAKKCKQKFSIKLKKEGLEEKEKNIVESLSAWFTLNT